MNSVGFFLDCLLQVLHETFPQHTFLMNGLVQGVKVRPGDADEPGLRAPGPGTVPADHLLCGRRRVFLDRSCLCDLTLNLCVLSGLPVVSLSSTDRCSVRYLGEEVLPPPDRLLHLCPHPVHEDQPMVSVCVCVLEVRV